MYGTVEDIKQDQLLILLPPNRNQRHEPTQSSVKTKSTRSNLIAGMQIWLILLYLLTTIINK